MKLPVVISIEFSTNINTCGCVCMCMLSVSSWPRALGRLFCCTCRSHVASCVLFCDTCSSLTVFLKWHHSGQSVGAFNSVYTTNPMKALLSRNQSYRCSLGPERWEGSSAAAVVPTLPRACCSVTPNRFLKATSFWPECGSVQLRVSCSKQAIPRKPEQGPPK
jgi:hypothetical protein